MKAPLRAISQTVEMVLSQKYNPLEVRALLLPVVTSAKMLTWQVNSLLDRTMIKNHKFTSNLSLFDLREALNEVVDIVRIQADLFKNKIKLKINFDLAFVGTDCERLQQVLLNLLTNANKFTRDGEITVTCTSTLDS